jgi:uracil-DNA glycosylase
MLIPDNWNSILHPEIQKPYFLELQDFINSEYSQQVCFPEQKNIFRAMEITGFDDIRVVILGQDPYHTPLAAM